MADTVTAMRQFRVWAPAAESVTLVLGRAGDGSAGRAGHDQDEVPMRADDGGWWSADVNIAPFSGMPRNNHDAAVDYGFRLGDGPLRPDPRSLRQPGGVHKMSRTFDLHGYRWRDRSWTGRRLAGSVIYELHIGTFTPAGTLLSAIDRLDHLVDLGVDFVELLPVNAFNGSHNWGYDGVLWFAVHEPYGGPSAYQSFVDACHARGIGVIQDVVYNHLGPSGNYLPEFGPYLRTDKANTWGASINLDGPGSDEVRRYIIDNALMWLRDFHVDGLRLDAVHALTDSRATPLLEELAVAVETLSASVGRPLSLIAESDLNDPRLYAPRIAGGYGLDASWNDDFHHAVHVAVTGETTGYYADFAGMSALAKVLTRGYFHDGTYSSFRGRHHGRPIDRRTTEAWRLVGFVQDHDQIGNRAAGDRLSAMVSARHLAVAAVLLLTGPFTPMLFMGEEWAASTPWQFFTSHPEEELGEQTRLGRIEEFARHGWDRALVPDPQDPATFQRSKLDWDERNGDAHAEIFDLYRRLIALRHRCSALTDPWLTSVRTRVDEARGLLVMRRGDMVVAVNLSGQEQQVRCGDPLWGDPPDSDRSGPADGITGNGLPGGFEVLLRTDEAVRLFPGTAAVQQDSIGRDCAQRDSHRDSIDGDTIALSLPAVSAVVLATASLRPSPGTGGSPAVMPRGR